MSLLLFLATTTYILKFSDTCGYVISTPFQNYRALKLILWWSDLSGYGMASVYDRIASAYVHPFDQTRNKIRVSRNNLGTFAESYNDPLAKKHSDHNIFMFIHFKCIQQSRVILRYVNDSSVNIYMYILYMLCTPSYVLRVHYVLRAVTFSCSYAMCFEL